MTRFIASRLFALVPVVILATMLVFFIMSLIPGDAASAMLGTMATPESLAQVRAQYGLDQPLPIRYLAWIGNVLQGDLGTSFVLRRPVAEELFNRLGPTALLAGSAFLLSAVLGVLAGVVMAVRQNGATDKLLNLVVLVGVSTPSFWMGLLLILVFAMSLRWLPVGGMMEMFGGGGPLDIARHLILPMITLAAVPLAVVARMTRTAVLEVLRSNYVRTARAKGVGEAAIIARHVTRNALVPVVPVIGLQAGYVLGGAIYVESVFQWPGLGRMLVDGISQRDFLLVQGGVLVVAILYILFNLVSDVVQAVLDPRLQVAR